MVTEPVGTLGPASSLTPSKVRGLAGLRGTLLVNLQGGGGVGYERGGGRLRGGMDDVLLGWCTAWLVYCLKLPAGTCHNFSCWAREDTVSALS